MGGNGDGEDDNVSDCVVVMWVKTRMSMMV